MVAGTGEIQELGTKKGQAHCLSQGHSIPQAWVWEQHLTVECQQSRVMGLKPREHDLEPERMNSGEGFILITAIAGRQGLNQGFVKLYKQCRED